MISYFLQLSCVESFRVITPWRVKSLFEDFDCLCLSYIFWQFIPGWYSSVEEAIRLYTTESIASKVWSQLKVVSSVWSRLVFGVPKWPLKFIKISQNGAKKNRFSLKFAKISSRQNWKKWPFAKKSSFEQTLIRITWVKLVSLSLSTFLYSTNVATT